MAAAHPINHTGIFTITTGLPGAPVLRVTLTVPANSSIAFGTGHLTQAVNPVLSTVTAFHGVVHVTGLGTAHQIYALQGQAIPPRLGATTVSQLSIVLDGVWGVSGSATYVVFNDTPHSEPHVNVPVTVKWLLQE